MKYFYTAFLSFTLIVMASFSHLKAQAISSFPFIEDFENGPAGWTSGGSGSTWAFGTPAKSVINGASSGVNCWVNGGLSGDYNNNENSQVVSPEFDFSSLQQPIIQMRVWWATEFSWDGAVLQYSLNQGGNWQTIGSVNSGTNWYNDNSINGNPGGQQQGWSGGDPSSNGSNGWVTAEIGVNALIGAPSVVFRIAFGSDGSITGNGFAFDDFLIFDLKGDDIGLLNVVSPTQDCNTTVPKDVTVQVRNFGFNTQNTFEVAYQLNNDAPVIENYSGAINQNQQINYTFNQQVDLSQDINYSIRVWLNLLNDENRSNDSSLNIGLKQTLPLGPIDFASYDGTNLSDVFPGWREAKGPAASGEVSDWTVGDSAQVAFFGINTAKVNMRSISLNDWLVSPNFEVNQSSRLYVQAATTVKDGTASAAMGSDDQLRFMISTDCGLTWAQTLTIGANDNLTNSFQQFALNLDPYIGQEIRFAFRAVDGPVDDPEDYDLHVTLAEARFVYPNDAGIISFRTGAGEQSLMVNTGDDMFITLKNFGSNTLSNVQVLTTIGNVNYQNVYSQNVSPNQEVEIKLNGGYFATFSGGQYVRFKSHTLLASDTINENDTLNTFLFVDGGLVSSNALAFEETIQVVPNPSSTGLFQIHNDTEEEIFVRLTDIRGAEIAQWKLNRGNQNLDLSDRAEGLYLLEMRSKTQKKQFKLVYSKN